MCQNPNVDLVNLNAYIKFVEILSICSKDIEPKKNLTSIKGHNSVTNLGKLTGNNPNQDLVNFNAYTKFGQILLIRSQDIKWKQNSDISQGHNSITNVQKIKSFNPNLDLVNINAYTKFCKFYQSVIKIMMDRMTDRQTAPNLGTTILY